MAIWELDKLPLFIAFIIPGFISIKCYQLVFPGTEHPTTEQIVDAVAYSSINYAILIPLIIGVENSVLKANYPVLYYVFYMFVLFLAPIVWVFLWKYLRTRDFVQNNVPHPTAKPWDYVFSQRKPYWVKVTLKDGTVIGGRYAENSFASSTPAEAQIYLEETWVLNGNGGFERKKSRTAGVIILSTDISHIELRDYTQEGNV